MKKIIALLTGIFMLLSSFAASAEVPEFMRQTYTNYTADYTARVQMKGAESIVALLEEDGMEDEVSRYVELDTLIEGLLSSESDMNIQCSISEDYKKIDLAMTAEAKQKVTVNSNLNADVTYGGGIWMHTDFTTEEPEFVIIYKTPIHNKYGVIDVMDYVSMDDVKNAYEIFKSIVTPEVVNGISDAGTTALEKYADITGSGNRYTIHLDNEGFIKMVDELVELVADEFVAAMENIPGEYGVEVPEGIREELDVPVLDTLEILGDKGITWIYELNPQGKIRTASFAADIDLNIAKIYAEVTGEEWEYSSQGEIELDIAMTMDVTNIGKTKPDFPVLTEENSFKSEFLNSLFYSYDYENEPRYYVYGNMDSEVTADGLSYFPLEEVMRRGYGNSYTSETSEGITTMESMYFNDISYVTVSVGSDMAYTDLSEHQIGKVMDVDGTVYVSEKFFTDVLGWGLDSYSVDLITGEVWYDLSTNIYNNFDEYINSENYDDEYDMVYPYDYAWGSYAGLEEHNGMYYVPLRATIEDAYDDSVNIVYSNGTVTMDSEWFEEFGKITLAVGDSVAYADGTPYSIGEIKVVDSSVYVSVDFFEDVFGWSLVEYSYDKIYEETQYEFETNNR